MPPASPSTAPRESARPASGPTGFDATADVVVVGGGGGGLPAALFARWLGDEVVLLEKAPRARRHRRARRPSGTGCRTTEPMQRGRHRGPRGGLPALHGAAVAAAALRPGAARRSGLTRVGARACPRDLRERLARRRAAGRARRAALPPLRGRARLLVRAARGQGPDRAACSCPRRRPRVDVRRRRRSAIRTLSAAAERDGVDVRTGHRVQRRRHRRAARWSASRRRRPTARRCASARARRSIFASGGFTHDAELRANFLSVPVYGGCAAVTNEGDFVRIARRRSARSCAT